MDYIRVSCHSLHHGLPPLPCTSHAIPVIKINLSLRKIEVKFKEHRTNHFKVFNTLAVLYNIATVWFQNIFVVP